MTAPLVVIVGAGLAGVTCALSALESGAEVLVLDRLGLGLGSNSALSNAVFAGPTASYPPERYIEDTLEIGKGLNRPAMLAAVAENARETFAWLKPAGLALSEEMAAHAFRPSRQDVFRGAEMMRALAGHLRGQPGLRVWPGFQATRLVREEGRLAAVEGLDRQGQAWRIPCGAAVLACGGAGAIFARNDNQRGALGQGYHLAWQAGLPLWDMEFVQFYPLVLEEPGLPRVMLYPPYPPQCRLLDHQGRDLAAAHGLDSLDQAIMRLRDSFALVVHRACQEGPVRMDYTGVPDEYWGRYPLAMFRHYRFDFRRRAARVAPGAHFCQGGVAVDSQAATGLAGLFACGEVVWGLHGANRRGGNALTECLVFGRLAGRSAAGLALSRAASPAPERLERPPAGPADPEPARREALARLREIAWQRAGVVREEAGLRQGLAELQGLAEGMEPRPEGGRGGGLEAGLFFLRALLSASLARRESRGCFQRADFPAEGGPAWRANSRLEPGPEGGFKLTHPPAGR